MEKHCSDMPFKLDDKRMVIIKELPVLQCGECGEYLLEDKIMAQVEKTLDSVDASAELEIVSFAA